MTSAWHTSALSPSPQAAACSSLNIAERGPGHLWHGKQGHSKVPSTQVPNTPSGPRCPPPGGSRPYQACPELRSSPRGWPRGGQRDLGQGCAWGISTTPSCKGFRALQAVKTSVVLLWSTSSWCQRGAGFLQTIQPFRPNLSLNPLAHEPAFIGFPHARSFPFPRWAESADNPTGISPGLTAPRRTSCCCHLHPAAAPMKLVLPQLTACRAQTRRPRRKLGTQRARRVPGDLKPSLITDKPPGILTRHCWRDASQLPAGFSPPSETKGQPRVVPAGDKAVGDKVSGQQQAREGRGEPPPSPLSPNSPSSPLCLAAEEQWSAGPWVYPRLITWPCHRSQFLCQ